MSSYSDIIYDSFKQAGIRQVPYLPDAGHARLIDLCLEDPEIRAVPLATEMEGIGIACGAWLGGDRAAVLMQSSGVGNCINALSLPNACRFPLLMLVAMRGEFGEGNRWQVSMGQATRPVLEAMGMHVYDIRTPDAVARTIDAAMTYSFQAMQQVAVLLSQELIGAKKFIVPPRATG